MGKGIANTVRLFFKDVEAIQDSKYLFTVRSVTGRQDSQRMKVQNIPCITSFINEAGLKIKSLEDNLNINLILIYFKISEVCSPVLE